MNLKHILLAAGVAAMIALPAQAQVQRIGTIDLRKVFDNYWKTKQADLNLKEEATGMEKESKAMIARFQKDQESYKKKLDSVNETAIAPEEREKRKKAAEEDLMKLNQQKADIEQFERQARATLGEKQRRMRDNILGEIKEVIRNKAKTMNVAMVVDVAAETVNNTPVVLFSSGENDISNDVLQQLNINAPAGANKPAGDTKPESKPDAKPETAK